VTKSQKYENIATVRGRKEKSDRLMRGAPARRTMKMRSIIWRMKREVMTKLMAVMWIRRLIFDGRYAK